MEEFLRIFRATNKYDQENGLELEIHSPGTITYKMKILEKHLSSPDIAHGAVIAGFMDCVLGVAALGTGKVIHRGKSLIISSAEVRNAKTQELVAMGQGTFNTYPITKKEWINDYKTPI